jgi:hypothetical protein
VDTYVNFCEGVDMETRPEPPPEGRLIEAAAARLDISIREAARRAGISYGRWRQIVKGYQNIGRGIYGPVRNAPARTIAKMARAAGVTPAQLAAEGCRPDAAAILAGLLEAEDEPTLPGGIPPVAAEPDLIAVRIGEAIAAELRKIADGIRGEVDAGRRAGIPDPEIFTDPFERNLWLTPLTPEDQRVLAIAALRSVRPRRPPNSTTNNPPIELAG